MEPGQSHKLVRLQQELQQYKASQACIQLEICQMKRAIDTMSHERLESRKERDRIEQEMECLKDMCAKLKVNKDNLCKQVEEREQEFVKIQSQKRQLFCRVESLRSELDCVRTRCRELSGQRLIVQQSLSQTNIQNVLCDLKGAQKQLGQAECKLLKVCRDLRNLGYRRPECVQKGLGFPCGCFDCCPARFCEATQTEQCPS